MEGGESAPTVNRSAKPKIDRDCAKPGIKSTRPKYASGDLDATRLYLSEIGYSPLLTAAEEIALARRGQKGNEIGVARES